MNSLHYTSQEKKMLLLHKALFTLLITGTPPKL